MGRSKWKGPSLNNMNRTQTNMNYAISLARSTEITAKDVDSSVSVHCGDRSIIVKITKEMIGHKVGEFAPTKECAVFKKKKNK